jgi:hypothetical protein
MNIANYRTINLISGMKNAKKQKYGMICRNIQIHIKTLYRKICTSECKNLGT